MSGINDIFLICSISLVMLIEKELIYWDPEMECVCVCVHVSVNIKKNYMTYLEKKLFQVVDWLEIVYIGCQMCVIESHWTFKLFKLLNILKVWICFIKCIKCLF